MESVEEILDSLNRLFRAYLDSGRSPDFRAQIIEQANLLLQEGYIIQRMDRDPTPEEAAFLAGSGRRALEELEGIKQEKTTAISRGEFERAADLRELENRLRGALWEKIRRPSSKPFFVLSENEKEIIVFGCWPVT